MRRAFRLAARADEGLSDNETLRDEADAELAALAALDDDSDFWQAPKETFEARPCMTCERTFTPTYRHNTVCPECRRSDDWRTGHRLFFGHHDTRLDGGKR